jgi:SAM-dependent methyltransferase
VSGSSIEHWQTVWTARAPGELSWHQERAATSVALVEVAGVRPDTAVIDVGGGDSPLAGELLGLGFTDVTVLDLSEAALTRGRERLGADAERVTWVAGDVLTVPRRARYGLWHDRAVFHFLTGEDDRGSYVETAAACVVPGGSLVVATFAIDGPERCSGLPVRRHDAASLADTFAPAFGAVEFRDETHVTPAGAEQRFVYGLFRRA